MRTSHIRYHPRLDALGSWAHNLGPVSALVVGEPTDQLADQLSELGLEARWAKSPFAMHVPAGLYALRRGQAWHLVILPIGGEPVAAREDELRHVASGDPLASADHFLDTLWDGADSVGGGPLLVSGAMVRLRGDGRVGRVVGHRRVADTFRYTVVVDGERREIFADSLEQIAGDPRSPQFWIQQPVAEADQVTLTLTWTKLRHPLTDVVYSFQSSKTVFRAYQFRPVLKMLNAGLQRLLIADEVGLGKTIEAGLIWSELEQRSALSRVLVVCPAALVLKWKAEMERRFDRQLEVLRRQHLTDLVEAMERGDADKPLIGVVSLESLRGSEQLERLAELHPRFDLVVVDEAHYLRNRETRSHELGRLLADWADALVFLSATPLNLRSTDLFNLLNLLDEDHFGDVNVFDLQIEPNRRLNEVARRLASDGLTEPRKLLAVLEEIPGLALGAALAARPDFGQLRRLLDVNRPLSHPEMATAKRHLAELNTLSGVLTRTRKVDVPDAKAVRVPRNVDVQWTEAEREFYAAVWAWYSSRAKTQGIPPGFAMQMPLRQAASCIPAMQQLLSERDPRLFLDAVDDADDALDAGDYAELAVYDVLRRPMAVDTKFDQLLATLREARAAGLQQVMIFSFFRRTLAYLSSRLRDEFRVAVMHGGVVMADRERIMGDFRNGEVDLLLLSEVGSEGLDFEFCNVLVNYDLPWNPMRVEQRIGRLDRFGQQHEKIFIYNMRVPGTIEADIFQRLYDRIHVFESSIGELEPILRDELAGFAKRVLDPRLNRNEREAQVQRIAVAIEQRQQMVDEIRESQGLLAGVDQLLIEGFTDDSPGRGRFVGPGEVRSLVDALLRRHGGRTEADRSDPARLKLIGTPDVASRLLTARVPDAGSKVGRSRLASMLREGRPVDVTLSSEQASHWDIELLSTRHPLVRLAVDDLEQEVLDLRRFGRVALPGLSRGSSYLAVVYLAESTGLRPALELWGVAVDAITGTVSTQVGELLLTALADGRLGATSQPPPEDVQELLSVADDWMALWQREVELERRQDNAALVEARLQSQRESIRLKILRAEATLDTVLGEGRGPSIVRLHTGRIRHLRQRLAELEAEMEPKKLLTLTVQPVAVVVAVGGGVSRSRGS